MIKKLRVDGKLDTATWLPVLDKITPEMEKLFIEEGVGTQEDFDSLKVYKLGFSDTTQTDVNIGNMYADDIAKAQSKLEDLTSELDTSQALFESTNKSYQSDMSKISEIDKLLQEKQNAWNTLEEGEPFYKSIFNIYSPDDALYKLRDEMNALRVEKNNLSDNWYERRQSPSAQGMGGTDLGGSGYNPGSKYTDLMDMQDYIEDLKIQKSQQEETIKTLKTLN